MINLFSFQHFYYLDSQPHIKEEFPCSVKGGGRVIWFPKSHLVFFSQYFIRIFHLSAGLILYMTDSLPSFQSWATFVNNAATIFIVVAVCVFVLSIWLAKTIRSWTNNNMLSTMTNEILLHIRNQTNVILYVYLQQYQRIFSC